MSFAQTKGYHPFPQVYANWWMRTTYYSANSTGIYQSGWDDQAFYTAGDSVSNGFTYKQINRIYVGPVTGPMPASINFFYTGGSHAFSYRNDSLNKKVFMVGAGKSTETLWYDFNLAVGDTVKGSAANMDSPNPTMPHCFVIVNSIDSVLLCNQYHKQFHCNKGGFQNTLIEGQGFVDDFIVTDLNTCTFEPPYTASTTFWSPQSSCQAPLGIQTKDTDSPGIRMYPNPVNALLFVETPAVNENALISITDLAGRTVITETSETRNSRAQINASALANGIYFLNISCCSFSYTRKFVVQH